jgi:hypothetical protein
MVALSYSLERVPTLSCRTTKWLERASGAQNSLQAVIFTHICKIENKFFGPIVALWNSRIAYRESILCPSGRRNVLNELQEPKTVCRL